jgi:hypothetical protein
MWAGTQVLPLNDPRPEILDFATASQIVSPSRNWALGRIPSSQKLFRISRYKLFFAGELWISLQEIIKL